MNKPPKDVIIASILFTIVVIVFPFACWGFIKWFDFVLNLLGAP